MKRFWEKVRKSEDPNGCWEWTAHKDKGGYGRFQVDGRNVRAHRWAYEHLRGPIPPKNVPRTCERGRRPTEKKSTRNTASGERPIEKRSTRSSEFVAQDKPESRKMHRSNYG